MNLPIPAIGMCFIWMKILAFVCLPYPFSLHRHFQISPLPNRNATLEELETTNFKMQIQTISMQFVRLALPGGARSRNNGLTNEKRDSPF